MMKAFDAFGISIAEGYGITECSPLISVNPYYALKVGSVGPAVPSCTVRIGDSTSKNVFPEEIEEYLSNIEEIGEAVVVGRVGEDGETINLTALVYPNTEIFGESFDKDAAYEAINKKILDLNRRMPSFKVIKALEIREEPFEKTTSRKIKRHLVK